MAAMMMASDTPSTGTFATVRSVRAQSGRPAVIRDASQTVSLAGQPVKHTHSSVEGGSGITLASNGGPVKFVVPMSQIRLNQQMWLEFTVTNNNTSAAKEVHLLPVWNMFENVQYAFSGQGDRPAQVIKSMDLAEPLLINAAWPQRIFEERAEDMAVDAHWQPKPSVAKIAYNGASKKLRLYLNASFIRQGLVPFGGAGLDEQSLDVWFYFRTNCYGRLDGSADAALCPISDLKLHFEDFMPDAFRWAEYAQRHKVSQAPYAQQFHEVVKLQDTVSMTASTQAEVKFRLVGHVIALIFGIRFAEVNEGMHKFMPISSFKLRGPGNTQWLWPSAITPDQLKKINTSYEFTDGTLFDRVKNLYCIPLSGDLSAALKTGASYGNYLAHANEDHYLEITPGAEKTNPVLTLDNTAGSAEGRVRIEWTDPVDGSREATEVASDVSATDLAVALAALPNFRDKGADLTFSASGAGTPLITDGTITFTGTYYGNIYADKVKVNSLGIYRSPENAGGATDLTLSTAGVPGFTDSSATNKTVCIWVVRQGEMNFKNGKQVLTMA